MRTDAQISKIKETQSASLQLNNFVDTSVIHAIIDYYNDSNKLEKPTGPITCKIPTSQGVLEANFLNNLLADLHKQFGHFKVWSAQIFKTKYPHVIHNDDHEGQPNCFKTFLIPLVASPTDIDQEKVKTVTYNQHFYHGAKKFFNGENDTKNVYKNQPLYEYSMVEDLTDIEIEESIRKKELTHLQANWLKGLSIENMFTWKKNSCIVFDTLRLHSASDFTQVGIEYKMGLSIFTEI